MTDQHTAVPPVERVHFPHMPWPNSDGHIPTGLLFYEGQYQRVPLYRIFPQLEGCNLTLYYHLRIACCAYLIIEGPDTIADCDICDGKGWVCPMCTGARMLRAPWRKGERSMACPGCTYDRVDEKGKIHSFYDAERAEQTARGWLAKRFPYGLPSVPTQADLDMMHLA